MAITDLCLQRINVLLTQGPPLARQIELNTAEEVAVRPSTISRPPTGFATVDDYRECLLLLLQRAKAAGIATQPLTSEKAVELSKLPATFPDPRAEGPVLPPKETTQPALLPVSGNGVRSPCPPDQILVNGRCQPRSGVQIPKAVQELSRSVAMANGFGFNTGFNTLTRRSFTGDVLGGVSQTIGLPTSGQQIGERLGGFILDRLRLGGGTGGSSSPGALVARDCPEGFRPNNRGECVAEGIGGAIARVLPGGSSGTMADVFGEAVIGGFGTPALVPAQVAQQTLRCPRGSVLGKDNLCYRKGSIPVSFRKWRPGPRPPVSGSDAKAIRKADSARKRVKALAQKSGFTCATKGTRRSR